MKKAALALLASVSISTGASANLVVNGGFEDMDVPNNSWNAFEPTTVPGWSGSWVEIWDSLNGQEAYEGEQLSELNSVTNGLHDPYLLFQQVEVTSGDTYTVSFAYQGRNSLNEQFRFSLLDEDSFSFHSDVIDQTSTEIWSMYTFDFVAPSDSVTLEFASVSTGGAGNLLDDVVLVAADDGGDGMNDVPLHGSMAALLPLGALAWRRRQQTR